MDGTNCNIGAFRSLGASLITQDPTQQGVSFPHPSGSNVVAILDPPHCFKNIRGALAHFGYFVWPGEGKVMWELLVKLHELQKEHQLHLGTKLTSRHVNFHQNKMKVKLAVQAVASDSVARALRWLYSESIPGFESPDTLVTAKFIEHHNKVFDLLNTRSLCGQGFKKSLMVETFYSNTIQRVCQDVKDMYAVLTDPMGKKLLKGKRKTGPLGALGGLFAVCCLVNDMNTNDFKLSYLSTYKFSQDHLELWFNAVRQRNGWSYNPSAHQFRCGFRMLLMHAGKNVIASTYGNCVAQDDTAVLSVSCTQPISSYISPHEEEVPIIEEEREELSNEEAHLSGCNLGHQDCVVCKAALSYIAGFITCAVGKALKCVSCKSAISHSEFDPCLEESLIHFKNFVLTDFTNSRGLTFLSGSLCRLLIHCERAFRRNQNLISHKQAVAKLQYQVLLTLDFTVFPNLATYHAYETSIGVDNRYWSLVQLIVKQYLCIRLKKAMKEMSFAQKSGNSIHHSPIFQNI